MCFLHAHVFEPVLLSPSASISIKQGIRQTIMRMERRDVAGMVRFFWVAVIGTERSIGFAASMKKEGFTRFEEILEEFRLRFNDKFIKGS